MSKCIVALMLNIELQGFRNYNSMKDVRSISDLSIYNSVFVHMVGGFIDFTRLAFSN